MREIHGTRTSLSLLSGLRAHEADAWDRLVHIYGRLVLGWCRRYGIQAADAADIAQEVFKTVFLRIGEFRKQSEHAEFRAWLRSIFRNKCGDYLRKRRKEPPAEGGSEFDAEIPEPDIDSEDPRELAGIYQRAMELIRSEFEEKSWTAFWKVACENQLPVNVAAELKISLNAVYVAKSRILRRLRETLGDEPIF